MDWTTHIKIAQDAVDEHESRIDAHWREVDEWLARRERRLREDLLVLLLLWPFGPDGRLDRSRRRQTRSITRRAIRAIDSFEHDALIRLVGTTKPVAALPPNPRTASGLRRAATRTRQRHLLNEFDAAVEMIRDFGRAGSVSVRPIAPADTSPADTSTEDDRADEPRRRRRVPRLPESESGSDERDEMVVITIDDVSFDFILFGSLCNPTENEKQAARQWREGITDLGTGRPTRKDVVAHVTGASRKDAVAAPESRDGGMRLHRGHMRLSVETHARAAFRSAVIASAERSGFEHFALIAPTRRLAGINPNGSISRQLYRVRTGDEWREIIESANLRRRASSGLEFGGLHHGDFSIPIPVPPSQIDAARRWSQSRRDRMGRAA